MNGQAETPELITVGELPRDVLALLEKAKDEAISELRFEAEPSLVFSKASRAVRRVSKELSPGSRDIGALRALSDANAAVVAAVCVSSLDSFPHELTVEALVPLTNLYGSIGRELEAGNKYDEALERCLSGLSTLSIYRTYRPWNPVVDKIAFWLILRAATVVGVLAAQKGFHIPDMLDVFDSNMEPFVVLLGDGDFQVPRSASVLSYARQRMTQKTSALEMQRMRDELREIALIVEPRAPAGKSRFSIDLGAILAQIDLRTSNSSRPAFRWSK